MKNILKTINPWQKNHIWRIATITITCALLYYVYVFFGLAGSTYISNMLRSLHEFYGIDFYGLIFFAPVVYAAYTTGVKGALATSMVCLLILFPYSIFTSAYPNALLRPAAFTLILSAVGAVIAMLQKSDEQRRENMREIKCLYDIGKLAAESHSMEIFLSSVIDIIPQAMTYPQTTKARISFRDISFESPDFKECPNKVEGNFLVSNEIPGKLEICCKHSRPYLKEHYALIRTLAERIGGAIHAIELEQSLDNYYEQLEKIADDRSRSLEKAQERLRLLSNTVKSSIDGITLADMEGNITFANEASQKMWGYSFDEITRLKISQLYSPAEVDLVEKEIVPKSKSGVWEGELTAVRRNSSQFPIMVTTSPVYDESGKTRAIVGVHRDITDTITMRDKLIRSERLAAVGELASGVSHELRNPLNVIRNCAYLLNMTLAENADEETLHTLKLLDQQVDISNKIVTDLLNFTRVRPPSPAVIDLHDLIKESLPLVTLPEEITVISNFNGNSYPVITDAEQIGRVFTNIISNARQAINGQGQLTITTGTEDSYAWVKFEDTGSGIAGENLDKIFEPLFTTKAKGIGLGLAITKRLVEQNNGTIEVTSRVNEGTTFTVKLPMRNKESK